MDAPPIQLINLATVPAGDTNSLLTHLHDLAADSEYWPAFRDSLGYVYDYLISHPDDASQIASLLESIVASFTPCDMPKEFSFFNSADDAFHLARQRIGGNEGSIREKFMDHLQTFGQ
jgi:hypothetical protein